ncbi:MAG: KpsF/GutQ family sugar-phosphate isomerase [Maricaulaceae bacterium]|jgi:arabinose-5-phosphate isomerase
MTKLAAKPADAATGEGPVAAARRALEIEIEGLEKLAQSIDGGFKETVERLYAHGGRAILCGVGKSGHVARKIAATLASTGTPAQFVHPTEASHGDLGMISAADTVIALSRSGETKELADIVAYCRRHAIPLIAMTAKPDSMLGRAADIVLALPDAREACNVTNAPTTSTTMQIALGDALAVALIERRGFTADDFGDFHPGGSLGAALMKVSDLMHVGDEIPLVQEATPMSEAIVEMSAKSFGCVGVLDGDGALAGVVTDGDLRRHMGGDLLSRTAGEVMTVKPRTIGEGSLAAEALRKMTGETPKVTVLFVLDEAGRPAGLVHLHDLLRAGLG